MAKPKTTHNPTSIFTETDKPLKPPYSKHAAATQRTGLQNLFSDDLIRLLANSYENKRARQVSEWERTQAVVKKPFK